MIQKSNPDDLFEGIFIKMIGIYKITNPNGKVYIGQSVDIEKRLSNYKRLSQSILEQPAIYNSLLKQNMSDETKLKMSVAKKGTKQSIETRLKRSESMKKTLEAKRIKQIY